MGVDVVLEHGGLTQNLHNFETWTRKSPKTHTPRPQGLGTTRAGCFTFEFHIRYPSKGRLRGPFKPSSRSWNKLLLRVDILHDLR